MAPNSPGYPGANLGLGGAPDVKLGKGKSGHVFVDISAVRSCKSCLHSVIQIVCCSKFYFLDGFSAFLCAFFVTTKCLVLKCETTFGGQMLVNHSLSSNCG